MAKLYVFGIGGTGARVIRSLTMMLASGVKIDADEIIPVIIDPDRANGDTTRTVELLKSYEKIRKDLKFDNGKADRFFETKINLNINPSVFMPIDDTKDKRFDAYIGYNGLSKSNKALASMLFSKKNLNADMEVGFKGNPNIGSVVLNQIKSSQIFRNVIGSIQQDDRIFIISSIFGGTGASGFPLLVKNIRQAHESIPNYNNARRASIGAITVLPYFGLKDAPESAIDSSSFISKTKAALSYYERNLNEANVLYYIADKVKKQFDNYDGGEKQENDAHIVEVISALAVLDFMSIDGQYLQNDNNNNPVNPVYKEFGIKEDADVDFSELEDVTNAIIKKPLTQMVLFSKFLMEKFSSSYKGQPWAKDLLFDENFSHSPFFKEIRDFVGKYMDWLEELARNERKFEPFEIKIPENELFSLVRKVRPAKVASFDSNYDLFNNRLNKCAKSHITHSDSDKNNNFVQLFYEATKILVEEKLRMN